MKGLGFVLNRTPARLAQMREEEKARHAEIEAWSRDLDARIEARMLPQDAKRAVWAEIQRSEPELQAFLQDPQVQDLVRRGATPLFPADLIRRARRNQAKKVANER